MRISDFNIGTRLYVGCGALVLVLIGVVALSIERFAMFDHQTAQMVKHDMPIINLAQDIRYESMLSAMAMRNLLVLDDPDDVKAQKAKMARFDKNIAADIEKLERQLTEESERALFKEIVEEGGKYELARADFMRPLAEGSKEQATVVLLNLVQPSHSAFLEKVQALVSNGIKKEEASFARIGSSYTETRTLLLVVTLVVSLLSAGLVYWLVRTITHPLKRAVQVMRQVAAGDLTQKIEASSRDEAGQLMQALRDMNDSLARIVLQVRGGTDTISTASSQIASGNQDLSSRTEQQASSLEETASSMEELTSTVKQNADNARQANQLAVSASEVAEKGGVVVEQVVHTMSEINQSARKIADIIGVIDGIAFQTNILALNAAVEAARAGEQGRGFAVVATEVRSLAQRSAAAAKEIKGLIGDSVDKVEAGSKLVGQAGATMDEIVGSVRRVTDVMVEILAASQEQSAGIEQVSQAIGQMDQVTQQNAALVEQAAAAAESMQDQAAALARLVATFKLQQGARIEGRIEPQIEAQPEKTAAQPVPAGKPPAALPAVRAPRKTPGGAAGNDEWEEF